MKLIIIQPFSHKPGHYLKESVEIIKMLRNYQVDIILIGFREFLDKKAVEGINNTIVNIDKTILFRYIYEFLKKLEKFTILNFNKLASYLISMIETCFCLFEAIKVAKRNGIDKIFLNSGNILIFFAITIIFQNFDYYFRLEDPSRRMHLNLYRFLKRKIENYMAKMSNYLLSKKGKKIVGICVTPYEITLYDKTGLKISKVFIPATPIQVENEEIPKEEAKKRIFLNDNLTPLFLVFGTNHSGKNNKIIFDAIRKITQNVYILFAGKMINNDNNPESLNRIYKYLNIYIHNKYIEETDLPNYFFACDAVLISQSKNFYHSGNLYLALRFKRPIIASNNEYIGEFVKENGIGLIFEPGDAESLASAINKFINLDNASLEIIYENIGICAEKFSYDKIAELYIKTFFK